MTGLVLTSALFLAMSFSPSELPAITPEADIVQLYATEVPEPEPKKKEKETYAVAKTYKGGDYDCDSSDVRALARALWSVTPRNPTRVTKIAFCELVQNRVDDDSGKYNNSIKGVLTQKGEFRDYDSDAHKSDENMEIARYAMNTWLNGDRSYRYVPESGVKCDFYQDEHNVSYILIYDKGGNVVFDSGSLKTE